MRINNKGAIVYQVGDMVKLSDTRPENWASNGDMDIYLGNVVTLTEVYYPSGIDVMNASEHELRGQIKFAGSSNWTFRTHEIQELADEKIMEEYKKLKEQRLVEFKEKFKDFVTSPEDVFAIAKDIFGEENIDFNKVNPTDFEIIVLFPEVNITNSRRYKHVIKDLYVKISVGICSASNVGDRLSIISLSGRRGKICEEEYHSEYGHSHFSGNGVSRWSEFCLGTSSDFSMIVQTMKFSLTQEDWSLFFLSLENYVSWESIEGGPYRNIHNISLRRDNQNPNDFRMHALELIKTIPNSCLTFNAGKVELLEEHPSLLEYYSTNTRIKSFRSSELGSFSHTQHRFTDYVSREYREFKFKGNVIKPVLYNKNTGSTDVSEEQLDQEVIMFYNGIIKKELKKYNTTYEYNQISSSSTLFREACTF